MAFPGPETDAELEGLVKEVLDYYSGADIAGARIDSIPKEIGIQYWKDDSSVSLKYRRLNAIAASSESNLADIGDWEYGVVTAFQIINWHDDKDQLLIDFLRQRAREQGVDLQETND